jgi:hypothetical protein
MKALYALYADPEGAQRAVDSLRAASSELKFAARQIVIVSGEPYESYDFSSEHSTRRPYLWAVFGGVVGGTLGYWLVTLAQMPYPIYTGALSDAPTGANVIVYQLTMLGAIAATLVNLFIGAGLPNFKGRITDPEIGAGKILVGVADPPENSLPELERRLLQAGASQVKQFSGTRR